MLLLETLKLSLFSIFINFVSFSGEFLYIYFFSDFGIPLTMETKSSPSKSKIGDGKTKIAIANTVKVQQRINYPMQLEEYQNKENENPQKDVNLATTKDSREPGFYSSEEDALYAQVNVRLEPEGESRDTEEESDRGLTTPNEILMEPKETRSDHAKLYSGCPGLDSETETEFTYSLPKTISSNFSNQLDKQPNNPEELYAAINKVRLSRKGEFPVPDEVWNVSDVKKTLHKVEFYVSPYLPFALIFDPSAGI